MIGCLNDWMNGLLDDWIAGWLDCWMIGLLDDWMKETDSSVFDKIVWFM